MKFEVWMNKPDAPDVEVLWTGLVLHKDVVAHVSVNVSVSDIPYGDNNNNLCMRKEDLFQTRTSLYQACSKA
jgi:hypothetical protein